MGWEGLAVNDLTRLLNRRLEALRAREGITAADVIRRAAEAGHEIKKSNLSRHLSGAYGTRMPEAETLMGFAVGLDLPVEELADAALRSVGVPMPVRRYNRRSDEPAVRGVCADCPIRSGFDELVLQLPRSGLTTAEIELLRQVVEDEITQLMDRRHRSSEPAE